MATVADLVENDPEGHEHVQPAPDVFDTEKMRALRDLVFFVREDAYKGRIQLPSKKKATRAVVRYTGPQCTEVEPGMVIHVHTHYGLPYQIGDEKLFVVHEDEIEVIEE